MKGIAMKKLSVDVAVIGTGTAGLAAYRAAKARAQRVLIIKADHTEPPARGLAACRASC
jgi:flavin-dependent dehydrogenase